MYRFSERRLVPFPAAVLLCLASSHEGVAALTLSLVARGQVETVSQTSYGTFSSELH